MRFFRSVLITILAAAILAPGLAAAGDAAWIDPLLSLLADHQAKAAGQPFDLALEQILAVDATADQVARTPGSEDDRPGRRLHQDQAHPSRQQTVDPTCRECPA